MSDNTIHCHVASFKAWRSCKAHRLRLAATLRADEQDRARRYRYEEHRHASVISRGLLRQVLAERLNTEPSNVAIHTTEFGKPQLADGLAFNVSHSGDCLLIAVGGNAPLGVDVEDNADNLDDVTSLAEHVFSRAEQEELAGFAKEQDRKSAFLRGWTRKEAMIKAVGGGLSIALDAFDVSLADEDPSRATGAVGNNHLLSSRWPSITSSDWQLRHLDLSGQLSPASTGTPPAALAVQSQQAVTLRVTELIPD